MALFESVAGAIRKGPNEKAIGLLESKRHRIPVSELNGAGDCVFAGSEHAGPSIRPMKTYVYVPQLTAVLHRNNDEVLPPDAQLRDVWAFDPHGIVGVIVWSPTQPYVWAFRFSWAPPLE
jgi:hypothetical protein